jgi:chromosome segregation ATPase
MVEPIMIFGIGFLVASLCALVLMPLVHNRAVRLTKKRLEAAAPLSMAELQADKDQLRAEFAVSTRRLELLIEQLKAESAGQFAELGKKTDAINLLKVELRDKSAQIEVLQANVASLQDQLNATSGELSAKIVLLQESERLLADKEATIAKFSGDLNERALAADSLRVEIITLRTQLDAVKDQTGELRNQLDAARKVEAELRAELAAAKRDIAATSAQEQAENAMLRERINEIAAEIAQLTVALEGPLSPIHAMLAAAADTTGGSSGARAGNGGGTTGAMGGHTRGLADRIRALQSKATRLSSTS